MTFNELIEILKEKTQSKDSIQTMNIVFNYLIENFQYDDLPAQSFNDFINLKCGNSMQFCELFSALCKELTNIQTSIATMKNHKGDVRFVSIAPIFVTEQNENIKSFIDFEGAIKAKNRILQDDDFATENVPSDYFLTDMEQLKNLQNKSGDNLIFHSLLDLDTEINSTEDMIYEFNTRPNFDFWEAFAFNGTVAKKENKIVEKMKTIKGWYFYKKIISIKNLKSICNNIPTNISKQEQLKKVFEYIVNNFGYNSQSYEKFINHDTSMIYKDENNIYKLLSDHVGVCAQFVSALALACVELGDIKPYFVKSLALELTTDTMVNHEFMVVQFADGTVSCIDPTVALGMRLKGKNPYDFFLRSWKDLEVMYNIQRQIFVTPTAIYEPQKCDANKLYDIIENKENNDYIDLEYCAPYTANLFNISETCEFDKKNEKTALTK